MACEYSHENYGFDCNHENKCSNKCKESKCDCNCTNECRYTIAEILRNISRYSSNTPVTVYLNGPSTISAHSTVSSVNLRVADNALISGSTGSKTVELSQTQARIAPSAIEISASGTADVPGLVINPRDVQTDAINVPLDVESTGTLNIDLSHGSADIRIPCLKVNATTASQTVNVPITQVGPIKIDTGSIDNIDIPPLEVCCRPCGGGRCGCEEPCNYNCNEAYDTFFGNEGYTQYNCGQGSNGSREICGCMKFCTKPGHAHTQGISNYVDVLVGPSLRASANIPSTEVCGQTTPENISAELSGQDTVNVTVSSVAGSNLPIPRNGVSGRTTGATDVPVTATGTNTNSVSLSGSVTIEGLPVSGSADTRGIPVTGSISVNTAITQTPVSFTGTIECANGNIVVLRERGTNREITISLCDVSKIKFPSFQGMQCMSGIFQQNRLDTCSCAYGIERALRIDKCKPGTIELYGSSTNNPIDNLINTKEILVVDGGVLWTVKGQPCSCAINTVYSLCNIAGYAFLGSTCGEPCGEPCRPSWEF